jgi:hypothetical protein
MDWRTGIAGAATALALLIGVGSPASADSGDVDIVGLRLGMTVDEAREAIRKYNPDLKIQPPVEKVLQYRVGNETRKTDPFVSYLFAVSGKKQKDDIYVFFSFPPGEPRAVAITRLHNNFDPPIPRETYYKALVEKYGEPSAAQKDRHGDEARRQYWHQWHVGRDKVQCAPNFDGGRDVEGQFGSLSARAVERGEVLKRITDGSTGKMRNAEAGDPSDCATLLTYELNYDPLFAAMGALVDIAGAAESERRMSQWLEELARHGDKRTPTAAGSPKL